MESDQQIANAPRGENSDTYAAHAERAGIVREADPSAAELPAATAADAEAVSLTTWLGESFATGVLYVLAALVGGLGVLGGLYHLSVAAASTNGMDANSGLTTGMWIVGGLAAGGMLVGLGLTLTALARHRVTVRDLARNVELLTEQVGRLGSLIPDPQEMTRVAERLDRLSETVDEVAHNCLLDEAGRSEKRRQVLARQQGQAVEQVRREMSLGQWDRAAFAMERFRMNFPAEGELVKRLAEELDRRRQQAESDDIADCRRQCEELISVSAWDRALALVHQLVQRHPDSGGAKALAARMEREYKLTMDEQRRQLYMRIQRHTSRREWTEALESARQLVDRFADSIEAEAIKTQIDTLAANAEIQHRQQLERAITDLVRRQRLGEAVALAEKVIADYPNSPQAAALRDQLPKLKERAGRDAAKR